MASTNIRVLEGNRLRFIVDSPNGARSKVSGFYALECRLRGGRFSHLTFRFWPDPPLMLPKPCQYLLGSGPNHEPDFYDQRLTQ